jgi:Flp pilus assembly protein TadD
MNKPARFVVLTMFLIATIARGQDTSTRKESEKAYAQGNIALDNGDIALAIGSFSEAIRLDPKRADACFGRALGRENKGEFDEAIADYDEAIRLDPKAAEAHYGRGLAHEKKGEKAKADEDFAQAKKLGYPRK